MFEGLFAEMARRSMGLDGLNWELGVSLTNVVQSEIDLATRN